MSKPYLAIVAIVRDEVDYIDEWIAYHEIVGVEHFYIYDNGSIDGTPELLRARPNVTVYDWPGDYQQFAAYANATVRCDAQWLAFIDIDEFLFPTEHAPVPDLLMAREGYDAVGVCWAMFGTSEHKVQPTGGVLASYTRRAAIGHSLHRHVKSIIQPARVGAQTPVNAHFFRCATYDMLDRRIEGPFARDVTWAHLRLNHYWSKSEQEAEARNNRPRVDCPDARRLADPFNHNPIDYRTVLNKVRDDSIAPYVELVAERLRA